MDLAEQEISDSIHASVQAFIVSAIAIVKTSAQGVDVHQTFQIIVDIVAVVLAPHWLTVEPAGPHLNGAERVEIDLDREVVDVVPVAASGFIGECGVENHPVAESTTVQ